MPPFLPFDQACAVAAIGLLAGILGGLAGVGGSVFILPALHIVFSPLIFGEPADLQIHHLYMAAGMTVNFAVSLPAALRHHRQGAVRVPLLRTLIPVTSLAGVGGVYLSNFFHGETLRLLLAFFLILYCTWNLSIIARPRRRSASGQGRVETATPSRLAACGTATGILGGLLGLGGGFLLVPLLQLVCNLRLKQAIATSSAVLVVTAAISAILKLATLSQLGESVGKAAIYIACLAPTAVIGSLLGSRWLHVMPVTAVRTVMTFLILAAATKLIG